MQQRRQCRAGTEAVLKLKREVRQHRQDGIRLKLDADRPMKGVTGVDKQRFLQIRRTINSGGAENKINPHGQEVEWHDPE